MNTLKNWCVAELTDFHHHNLVKYITSFDNYPECMAKGEVRNVDWLVNHSRESWRSAFDQTERRPDDQVNTIDPLVPLDLVQRCGRPLLQVGDLHWPPAGVDWPSGIPENSRWADAYLGLVQVVNWAGTVYRWQRWTQGFRVGVRPPNAGQRTRLQGGALVTPPGQVHLSCSYLSWRFFSTAISLALHLLDRFALGYHTSGNYPWQPSSQDSLRALKSLYHGQVERCQWRGGSQCKCISLCQTT